MAEKGAVLVVKWIGDVTGLEEASAKAEAASEKTSSKFSALKTAAAGAAVGGVLVLAEGLNKSVEAAQKDQVAQARLEQAFKNAHIAIGPYKDGIEKAQEAGVKLGFSVDQTKAAIGTLATATGSGSKALSELSAAQDIARFKGVSLEQATKMLAMAQTGSQRAVKQLGLEVQATTSNQDKAKFAYQRATEALKAQFPTTAKMTEAERTQYDVLKNKLDLNYQLDRQDAKIQDHQITGTQIIAAVTDKLHGQADAYANTAAGAKERFGAALDELEVKVGMKLLPILTKLEVWLADNLPAAIATLSSFWKAHGDQIMAGAQKLEAVVVPILRTVADTIRLVADLLQGHWSQAWRDAKAVVIDQIDAIKARIMLQFQIINAIFGGAAAKAHQVVDDIFGYFNALPGRIASTLGALAGKAIQPLINAFGAVGRAIEVAIKTPVNEVIRAIDSLQIPAFSLSIDTHIPGVGKVGFSYGGSGAFFSIPYLAQGGIVTSPTLAMIGEAGPEAVVPLSHGGFGGTTIVVNMPNYLGSLPQAMQAIRGEMLRVQKRNGRPILG
jgi:hypothetical protein